MSFKAHLVGVPLACHVLCASCASEGQHQWEPQDTVLEAIIDSNPHGGFSLLQKKSGQKRNPVFDAETELHERATAQDFHGIQWEHNASTNHKVKQGLLDGRSNSSQEVQQLASGGRANAIEQLEQSMLDGSTLVASNKSTDAAPLRNKIVLVALEMIPLLGPLGIDRFYLGGVRSVLAWVKLSVCICTYCTGGFIWGAIDAVIVIINCFQRQPCINLLGMHANFSATEIEPAHKLSVILIVLQIVFCFGCCGLHPKLRNFFFKSSSHTNITYAATGPR